MPFNYFTYPQTILRTCYYNMSLTSFSMHHATQLISMNAISQRFYTSHNIKKCFYKHYRILLHQQQCYVTNYSCFITTNLKEDTLFRHIQQCRSFNTSSFRNQKQCTLSNKHDEEFNQLPDDNSNNNDIISDKSTVNHLQSDNKLITHDIGIVPSNTTDDLNKKTEVHIKEDIIEDTSKLLSENQKTRFMEPIPLKNVNNETLLDIESCQLTNNMSTSSHMPLRRLSRRNKRLKPPDLSNRSMQHATTKNPNNTIQNSKNDISSSVIHSSGVTDSQTLYALGLYRKPAFPGFYQILQIQDQDIIDFLLQLKSNGTEEIAGFLTQEDFGTDFNNDRVDIPILRRDAGPIHSLSDIFKTGTILTLINVIPHSQIRGGQVIVMPQKRFQWLEETVLHQSSDIDANITTQPLSDDYVASSGPQDSASTLLLSSSMTDSLVSKESNSLKTTLLPTTSTVISTPNTHKQLPPEQPSLYKENKLYEEDALGETTKLLRATTESFEQSSNETTSSMHLQQRTQWIPTNESSLNSHSIELKPPHSKTVKTPLFLVSGIVCDIPNGVRFDASLELKALHMEIVATMQELLKSSYFYKDHFEQVVKFYNLDYPAKLADLVAGMSFANRKELQDVLEELNIEKRVMLVLEIIRKDLELARIQNEVKLKVEGNITKEQKKYVLTEQFKFIKKELGLERDDKQMVIQTFETAYKSKIIPTEVEKVIQYELQRLGSLEPSSAEFNISRTYLEWLTQLPWGITTTDNQDIQKAADILDTDHYGLKDVKTRLLEFMAITILKKDLQGKIICLVGPPGIGKTSVVKSMARALNRCFYRFSLSGLFDVAELRGHRRTYVGALPGKLIQALKQSKSMNPLILLDEIDKMGKDFRGDPASALLEILDPTQNDTFRDHYLDVPIDLSKVLFICTANSLDHISPPLLDRMEIIRLAGYVLQEKIDISKQYLIPQMMNQTGINHDKIIIDDNVLKKIIQDYAREAGVRNLQKLLEKIFRKVGLQIVRNNVSNVIVNTSNLKTFLGQPPYSTDKLYPITPPGVAMGLAWTEHGGAALYVESTGRIVVSGQDILINDNNPNTISESNLHQYNKSSGNFKVTGRLGDVMTESSDIALSFSKSFISKYDPFNKFLDEAQIHLHVPEGATPKDGPSAGITMATALISLTLNTSVTPNLAMTGELTLTGKIIRIGGVKEKAIAAHRERVKNLIFPRDNLKDYDELEDHIKNELTAYFVEDYSDVFSLAFPCLVKNGIQSQSPIIIRTPTNQLELPDLLTTTKDIDNRSSQNFKMLNDADSCFY